MRFFLVSLGLLAAACGENAPSEDLTPCEQFADLDTYGCAEVSGVVIDSSGRPLAGNIIAASAGTYLLSLQAQSDARGRYQLRIFQLRSPLVDQAHTTSAWIWAASPPHPNPPGELFPLDSVSVLLQFQPVGTKPLVARADTIVMPATSN